MALHWLKKWASSLLILAALAVSLFVLWQKLNGRLVLHFLDVGQGDSILINTSEGHLVLIDSGPNVSTVDALGKALGYGRKYIDLFVLTHPDRDHFGGALDVMKYYDFGAVMLTGISNPDPVYEAFLAEVHRHNIPIIFPHADEDWQIGTNTYLDILYPLPSHTLIGQKTTNKNNTSIVMRLIHKGVPVALLTGDAETPQETELLLAGYDLHASVLKLGHHGAKTSSSPAFLQAAGSGMAVVSAGKDNPYNHPHPEVLERLSVPVRRTDIEGTVKLVW